MKRAPIRDIIILFLVTRLVLMLITYFGYILLTAEQYSSAPVDAAFFTSWNHGDATHYLQIAHYGYQTSSDTAFFPLFPLLIAGLAHLLGNGDWSYLFSGMLISNIALLGTLFVLYQLVVESSEEEVAQRTLLYLCVFPTAIFFFTAYSEALFLLLTTSTFLALRRHRWWLAGLLGLGAALTGSAGILLIVPYLCELWVAHERIFATRYKIWLAGPPVLFILIGPILYNFYCWKLTGDPLAVVRAQSLTWPRQGLWQACVELFQQPFGSFYQVHVLLNLGVTLFFLFLTLSGWSRSRTSYSLWNILLLLNILLLPGMNQNNPLASSQHLALTLFPAFIILGSLGVQHPRLHQSLQIVGVMLQATLGLLFIMNRWMV